METSPGKARKWHWENRRDRIDRAWEHVVMQELSVLDYEHPGDPTVTIDYAGRLAAMMTARNPAVDVSMTATWTRPDQTYRPEGPWYGKPATPMAQNGRASGRGRGCQ